MSCDQLYRAALFRRFRRFRRRRLTEVKGQTHTSLNSTNTVHLGGNVIVGKGLGKRSGEGMSGGSGWTDQLLND